MKRTRVALAVVVALAGGILLGALLYGADETRGARAAREGVSLEQATALLASAAYDVDTNGALRLPPFDPKTNLHASKPRAYNTRRAAERLEEEYRLERQRRLTLARGIVEAASQRLQLTTDQASALYRMIMERGDTCRIAAYRNLFGTVPKDEKMEAITRAGEVFDTKLKLLLDGRQYQGLLQMEEEQGKDVEDLGFGAAYGRGGGKERAYEPAPRPAGD
ncbi:MAG: hypothetical protein ACYTEZ_15020 [Planctomycetota bacterium]|jgi:hypothetical protein